MNYKRNIFLAAFNVFLFTSFLIHEISYGSHCKNLILKSRYFDNLPAWLTFRDNGFHIVGKLPSRGIFETAILDLYERAKKYANDIKNPQLDKELQAWLVENEKRFSSVSLERNR